MSPNGARTEEGSDRRRAARPPASVAPPVRLANGRWGRASGRVRRSELRVRDRSGRGFSVSATKAAPMGARGKSRRILEFATRGANNPLTTRCRRASEQSALDVADGLICSLSAHGSRAMAESLRHAVGRSDTGEGKPKDARGEASCAAFPSQIEGSTQDIRSPPAGWLRRRALCAAR